MLGTGWMAAMFVSVRGWRWSNTVNDIANRKVRGSIHERCDFISIEISDI